LFGSFVVSLQPPPELLELATVDAEALDAPPALALESPLALDAPPVPPTPPELEAEADALTLESEVVEAPPAPVVALAPLTAVDVGLLVASPELAWLVSVATTTEPHAPGPRSNAAPTPATRLAPQVCSRNGILIGSVPSATPDSERRDHGTKPARRLQTPRARFVCEGEPCRLRVAPARAYPRDHGPRHLLARPDRSHG
jgi:hypothetical protein